MVCILCGKSNFEKAYFLATKKILRCRHDGLFIAQPTKKEKNYGQEYFSNEPNKFNESYFLNKISTIKRLLAQSSLIKVNKPEILDIGCGWGDFEEVLEKEKIPYLGIDVNKEAIEICKKKGLNCGNITIQQYSNESDKRYDCITLFQVIEHLQNPLPILKSAKKLLKPGGIILITTPNNDSPLRKLMRSKWSVYNEPSHYLFFNQKTLAQTLEFAGFKNIKIQLDSTRFLSSTYILNRILSTNYLLPSFPIPTDPWGDLIGTASL